MSYVIRRKDGRYSRGHGSREEYQIITFWIMSILKKGDI
jgi:hypothetical protein